jgi:hypothetical protein
LWRDLINHVPHHGFLFADAKASERIAIEADFNCASETFTPKLQMRCTLNDSE